ncbi:hypothetical protein LWC34_30240 [Kibdelosporangium philippinense]|uniref:DUF4440 domain-containing protein n=1 Tax=Kibdelosporangium philippinense TaxID=211113 RepID=A0ABS8ZKB6_9PSEU|nr:hypothetical protein [Kibdelosporangium philippinense]MCE7007076.1 hypothetical protein [Kibdelosporangium philippinense]
MPIRSDHGRNAVVRSLATWPLYSPRRLLGSLTVLAALGAGTTAAITAAGPAHAPATPESPAVAASTSPATEVPASTGIHPTIQHRTSERITPGASPAPNATPPQPTMAGDPTAASQRFAEAWVSKHDPQTWRGRLAPLCTDEFRTTTLLATTPTQISATTVTGPTTLIRRTGRSAEATVALDTMVLAIALQDITGSGDWRAAHVRPAR